MTWIDKEIGQQPGVIRNLLEKRETARQIVTAIRDFQPDFITIVARGTSDNAARYAQYLWGISARLPIALATPSLYTLYDAPPRLAGGMVIGISQSGKSEDIRAVIDDARQQGALTLSITNDEDSPMAQSADYHLFIEAGEEHSVAATKSYTAQLSAIALLASTLADDAEMIADLKKLPDWISETLRLSEPIADWADRYRYMENFAIIGRGLNYATAFEISLKIKELCYISGEEYSAADFLHGPIAMIHEGFPTMLVMPQGKPYSQMVEMLGKLRERKAECLVISNQGENEAKAHKLLPIPAMPEWLSPIAAVIPGQIFAKSLALAKGHDVDTPRGLNKVTVTR